MLNRKVTIFLNGKPANTTASGYTFNGWYSRTYVPIRYIVENAGVEVKWIAAIGEIVIAK